MFVPKIDTSRSIWFKCAVSTPWWCSNQNCSFFAKSTELCSFKSLQVVVAQTVFFNKIKYFTSHMAQICSFDSKYFAAAVTVSKGQNWHLKSHLAILCRFFWAKINISRFILLKCVVTSLHISHQLKLCLRGIIYISSSISLKFTVPSL